MKIYYSFPLQQLVKQHKKYREVIDLIKNENHSLTREWLEGALDLMVLGEKQPPRADMYPEIMKAIRDADACIFDVTIKSMSIGLQIHYALERRKPTIILSDISKGDPVDSLMISGSKSGYLHGYDYKNKKEMLEIVKRFLNRKDIHLPPQRYNLFLEKSLSDYIDWGAYHIYSSKTEALATAVRFAMEKDALYQDFKKQGGLL